MSAEPSSLPAAHHDAASAPARKVVFKSEEARRKIRTLVRGTLLLKGVCAQRERAHAEGLHAG